jgi:hypothetical protein
MTRRNRNLFRLADFAISCKKGIEKKLIMRQTEKNKRINYFRYSRASCIGAPSSIPRLRHFLRVPRMHWHDARRIANDSRVRAQLITFE